MSIPRPETGMSAYEQDVWLKLTQLEHKRNNRVSTRAAEWTSDKVQRAATYAKQKSKTVEQALDVSDAVYKKALEGLCQAVMLPAVRSVNVETRLKKAAKAGLEASSAQQFRTQNDLERVDKHPPRMRYTAALALESAASALAVTGAQLSTTVSGGTTAGVAVGAVAADTAATMAALGRAVSEIAAHYGYDPRQPEEERFILGILNFTTAATQAGKVQALQGLSQLTQQMMRQPTWKELEKRVLVKVVQRVFSSLGLRLTKQKLAQVVPALGVAVNAGLAVGLMEDAVRGAMHVYRLRFLSEKYDLDTAEWVADLGRDEPVEEVIDIEILPEDWENLDEDESGSE